MTIELKLFRLQRWIRPEWGQDELKHEVFILAADRDKAADHVYRTCGIRVNDLGIYKHWYDYDRCENEFILKEIECEIV